MSDWKAHRLANWRDQFMQRKLSDLPAQLAAMEQKGEWIGLPENCQPAVVEHALGVFKRIADYADSS